MIISKNTLYPEIETVIRSFDFEQISDERKNTLQPLVDYIQNKVNNKEEIRLNLICTHNSRRSHLSQIWAQTAGAFYNVKNLFCYSGGTEATALYPMVAETLQQTGFQIKNISEGKNPIYSIKFSANEHPVIGFSKTYDDNFNPASDYAAVMTCSSADEGCPFISGAEKRIAITFEDPKNSDETPQQKQIYQKRSLQIATEMFYVFSQIKQ
ncbi:arsenate-mycothiol transferase ArsC [Flavobacterium aquicola]|uniref:Arsenate reductase n=1 Tax=Flavobacterium aquicola TaxID=1682742 RepID=A0A3E0EIK6_9FLAO|nr:protein-tyrosine-phosphatase [Flavobacterium aquicola]REG98001.1 arsenate reductase [Flavobacterium aquicola]